MRSKKHIYTAILTLGQLTYTIQVKAYTLDSAKAQFQLLESTLKKGILQDISISEPTF